MPFVIGFLRVLLLLFVLRLVVRAVARLLAPASAARPAAGGASRPAAGVPLVRDRVCNTFLPRERALTARVGGHEEHFCSEACRQRALDEPGALDAVPRAS